MPNKAESQLPDTLLDDVAHESPNGHDKTYSGTLTTPLPRRARTAEKLGR